MFRIITDARGFREYALLRDGQGVLLRTATPADAPAIETLLSRVSSDSLRLRFMGRLAQLPRNFVRDLVDIDPRDRACLLVIIGEGSSERVVAFGNYLSLGGSRAEVAFLVEDAYQGRGISPLLLERLAGIAAGAGLIGFEAEVLFENQRMLNVFRSSGFEVRQALEGGCLHVEFPVSGAMAVRERSELRERVATAASLAPVLRPKVVAVVGASRRRTSVGGMIFRHALRDGFTGTVYPVNDQASSVSGVRAFPSVSALPEVPDLVVIAVPAERVLDVAEASIRAGARGLVVVTSGFAEAGPEGIERQRRLVELVRAAGVRLVGPNCLGLLNTAREVHLNASIARALPARGRVGFFSHSAALGVVILQHAAECGLGFSTFVSAGNRADVSGNDLLEYWQEDPSTDIAMLYLEAFGNARRFARVARRAAQKKPVLCVKSARSRSGRSAALAHIGARPLEDLDVETLFRQAGVVRLDTLEELFDLAALLAHQPLPPGRRVAVLSNSGGVMTITADACEARGLEIAPGGLVDLGTLAGAEDYQRAIERALADDRIDAGIVIFVSVGDYDPQIVGRGIRRGVLAAEAASGQRKPLLLCLMGATGLFRVAVPRRAALQGATTFPAYRFPEAAARALAHAAEYAAWRRRPVGRLVWFDDVDPAAARGQIERLFAARPGEDEAAVIGEPAASILGCFRVAAASGPAPENAVAVVIRPHPDFGPLLVLTRPGGATMQRITPLTDEDVRELLGAVGLPSGGGEEELVERLSQLVEEVPWLEALEASLVVDAGSKVALAELRLSLRRRT